MYGERMERTDRRTSRHRQAQHTTFAAERHGFFLVCSAIRHVGVYTCILLAIARPQDDTQTRVERHNLQRYKRSRKALVLCHCATI